MCYNQSIMNKPNYKNSIVNFSNSIIKHFGATPFHSSIPEVDKFLEGKKKVVLFLFDGMGKYVIEKHLPEDSFLRKHTFHYMTSTFPPTTVAATDALLSAKFPSETGWLGWTQYFSEVDKNVNMFSEFRGIGMQLVIKMMIQVKEFQENILETLFVDMKNSLIS